MTDAIDGSMMITPQQIRDKMREMTSPGQVFEVEEARIGGQTLARYQHAPATLIEVLQGARQHLASAAQRIEAGGAG